MEASSSINQINVSFGSSLLKMLANGGSGWLPIEIIVRENIWDFGKIE
jgi:hypothetical protein